MKSLILVSLCLLSFTSGKNDNDNFISIPLRKLKNGGGRDEIEAKIASLLPTRREINWLIQKLGLDPSRDQYQLHRSNLFIGTGPSQPLTNTGALLQLNGPGLTYAKQIGVKILNKKMKNFHIPDSPAGSVLAAKKLVSYKLKNMYVRGFNLPADGMNINLQPPNAIALHASRIFAYVTGEYEVKLKVGPIKIKHHGKMTAGTSGASANIGLALTQSGGKPHVSPTGCSLDLGHLKIHFEGSLIGKILNLLSGIFKHKIEKFLNKNLPSFISKIVNGALEKLPTSAEIKHGFNIDYSLTANPMSTSDSFVVPMLGRVWFRGHHDDPGIPRPTPITPVQDHQRMFCAKLEVAPVLGSFGYAAQVAGVMHYTVNGAILTKYHLKPEMLDCECEYLSCIGKIIPEIVKPCNGGSIGINMTSTAPPKAYGNSTVILLDFVGDFEFHAENKGKAPKTLFIANVTVTAVIPDNLRFEGWKIKGEVHVQKATLAIKSSKIGPIDHSGLNTLWKTVLMVVVEEKLGKVVENGIQLPNIKNVKVSRPELGIGPGFVQVCADANYTRPI